MQDYSDPTLNAALIATIHHECFLMKFSFEEFRRLGEKQVMSNLDAIEQVQLFSSYSAFLHHLYEFYVACFMREQGSDKGFSGKPGAAKKDGLFKDEAARVLGGIAGRLKSGRGEGWENDLSYYEAQVPDEFASSFRRIRNSTAHAISERASGDIPLSEFYAKYHKFIFELYRSAHKYWGKFEVDKIDMKEIGQFSVVALGP